MPLKLSNLLEPFDQPQEEAGEQTPPTKPAERGLNVASVNHIASKVVEVLSEEGLNSPLPEVTLGVQQALLLYQVSILQDAGKLPKA